MDEQKRKRYDVLPTCMITKTSELMEKVIPDDVNVDYIKNYKEDKDTDGAFTTIVDFEQRGSKYLFARDVCINNARVCEAFSAEIATLLYAEETYAQLDRAINKYGVLNEKTNKMDITDGKAKAYVNIDEKVISLRKLKNTWDILHKFFSDYEKFFDKKHDYIKKMLDIEMRTMENGNGRSI